MNFITIYVSEFFAPLQHSRSHNAMRLWLIRKPADQKTTNTCLFFYVDLATLDQRTELTMVDENGTFKTTRYHNSLDENSPLKYQFWISDPE
jgi:hypothetical protein